VTATEQALLAGLLELEAAASTHPGNSRPPLGPLIERLDTLTRKLPKDADPALLHYLHKRSYEKARLFLQGREAENQAGNCHV